MLSHQIHLISRINPLKYLFEKPTLVGHSPKWLLLLSEFDITHVVQKSMKAQAIADHIADSAIPDLEPINEEFSDEEILFTASNITCVSNLNLPWKVYFDGVVNRHGKGIETVLEAPNESKYSVSVKLSLNV
jgi:hypothetical protein